MVVAPSPAAAADDAPLSLMRLKTGFCCCLLLAGLGGPAVAIDRLTFSMESLEGADWRAEDLQWHVDLSDQGASRVRIARLALPQPYGEITALRIDCPGLRFEAKTIACPAGTAQARAPWLGKEAFRLSFSYTVASKALNLQVEAMPAFGGRFDLNADYAQDWRAQVSARHVAAAQLGAWLPALSEALAGWSFEGPLDADVEATSQHANYRFSAAGLTLSDDSGRIASEALNIVVQGELHRQSGAWRGPVNIELPSGQAYIEPVFVDFAAQPAEFHAEIGYADDGSLYWQSAQLKQGEMLALQASGRWAGELQALSLQVKTARLPAAYELYAKPFLLGTPFESLQTVGRIGGNLEWDAQGPQSLQASLDSVVLEDAQGRFAWDAVNGELFWRASGESRPSRLQWRGGSAYKVLFGPADMQLLLQGKSGRLLQPLNLPVLEGALKVNTLALQDWGAEQMALQFDGELKPLSLEALTTALGWPRFGGRLGGRLPELDYRDGVLTLGGALKAQVFDGEVSVENLKVQDPFGRLPQLFADVRARNLDLEAVTQAFSFGLIQGRLDGDIEALQMLNWKPVAFDARLATPEDDDSRHRISQRAIENISAIGGGGATAVLSRGFLQFFEDFAYDRIGLSCRLAGGVCQMGGVGPAKDGNGYILVKGKLLPRIDVIGYARQVDWATLVEQLKSVSEGEGPVLR